MKLHSSIAVLVGAVVLSGAGYAPRLRVNISDSMPRGLYLAGHSEITRGAIVAECLPPDLAVFGKERGYIQEGGCPGKAMSILKTVVGMPGDTVELADEYVAVNGHLLLNSATRKEDSKGRPIAGYPRGTFVLETGYVFLLATNSERSWDGRYTGPARIADLIATLQPVITTSTNWWQAEDK